MSSRRLDALLRLMHDASRAHFMRPHSFAHELLAKHSQQAAMGGGFTRWDERGLRFEYTVPEQVCFKGHMPLSAIVALVDETTTWASVGSDRHRRGGVSLELHAALQGERRPPQAGEKLIFEANVERMGRTIGFQRCEVYTDLGRHVASARHTKLLDMGRLWALAFGPLFPLSSVLLRLLARERLPEKLVENLEELLAPLSVRHTHDETSGVGTSQSRAALAASYTCEPAFLNEIGVMYGGAQAMLHEEVATRAAARALSDAVHPSDGTLPYPIGINVSYLAGVRVGEALELSAHAGTAWGGAGLTTSSQLRGANGVIRSESQMQFSR